MNKLKKGDLVSWEYQETDLCDRPVGEPTYAEGVVQSIDRDGWADVLYTDEAREYLHLGDPVRSYLRCDQLTVWREP